MPRRRGPSSLRAFDLRAYLGDPDRGVPPPYTAAQLTVMMAGSAGLYLALLEPTPQRAWLEARRNAEQNRARFPRRPEK